MEKTGNGGIMVVGDVHAEWWRLNALIARRRPSLVLSCGDFGYWPRFKDMLVLPSLKALTVPIHFCDGNHEDHESLRLLEDGRPPGCDNVYYQKRGTTLTLPDGRTVLFVGGADSIDKASRTRGVSWFPEEVITQSDLDSLPDTKIDIVISHTCPLEILPEMIKADARKKSDPSNAALSHILDKYRPSLWYFGHWHTFRAGEIGHDNGKTRWFCLNMTNEPGWWRWLEK